MSVQASQPPPQALLWQEPKSIGVVPRTLGTNLRSPDAAVRALMPYAQPQLEPTIAA
eukprot:CAMPEP_0172822404 /NCGR_PEP_ID=MMETSP1075-20121228/16654_1 /TAXON_ID=2916 /ORGANISM="Ceratium fusus, Strain PA161109" /LENGTH=56 /DNA_ID=CAMNT_0013663387 /DNA_START=48 /DNA_END=215 /DNA_ORIENTATION=-